MWEACFLSLISIMSCYYLHFSHLVLFLGENVLDGICTCRSIGVGSQVKRNQQRCLEWWVPGWSWHWQGQKARQVGGKAGHKAIASAFSSLAPLRPPQATKTSTFNSLSLLMGVIKGIQVNLALGLVTPWRIVSMYVSVYQLFGSYFYWGRNC